jgi:lipoprotein-anchoring transpeptidase ErfK/SrfK
VRIFAKRYVVKLREAPSKTAFRIGYLRGGAVLQAKTAQPIGYDKCRKGWFELTTGGFVCSTVDVIAFLGKRLPERQPLQPDLGKPLPYPYGYSRKRNTPMFRRLPSDDEALRYEGGSVTAEPPPMPFTVPSGLAIANDIASPEGETAPSPLAGAPGTGVIDGAEQTVPTLSSLQGEAGSVLMRRMERGFYVSLDREMKRGDRKYWRTQSNGFIPSKGLYLVDGSDFHGLALGEGEGESASLPIAFVLSGKDFAYRQDERGRIKSAGKPGYHHRLRVVSELEVRGTRYYADETGTLYRASDTTKVVAREKPAEVGDDEKWLDVDLSAQSLVAYVGARPVYATLISSGRIKDPLDPLKNFETPSGSFRISSKHLSASMDGDHALDGPYSIEDVPYVMYFQLAFALHAAFWHDSFGRPRSHGCINLAPLDAKWIFEFAEPELPVPWHGVYPREGAPGTRLYIHGTTPKG